MVDFSPDGVHVLTSSFGRVCLWTADAAKSRFCFPQRGVQEAVFTPDGKTMLRGGPGGIAMWSAAGALCWANAEKEIWGVFFSISKCGHKFWHDAEQDRHNG
jgi:WD40 repeat protein